MATSLDFASGLPTIHTAMGCVESKPDGFNHMKRQVREVHRGSSGCIHAASVAMPCPAYLGATQYPVS